MRKFFKTTLLLFLIFQTNSFAQNNESRLTSIDLQDLSNSVNLTVNDTFFVKKNIKSLMFDDNELDDINRAISSFKSGETYSPDAPALQYGQPINKNLQKEQREKEYLENNEKSQIHFSSMMYFSKNNWAIWLNKTKIDSKNNNKNNEFFVKEIDNEKARILWSLGFSKWKILTGNNSDETQAKLNDKNQIEVEFELKPNQTYILKTKKVIEGRNYYLPKKSKKITEN